MSRIKFLHYNTAHLTTYLALCGLVMLNAHLIELISIALNFEVEIINLITNVIAIVLTILFFVFTALNYYTYIKPCRKN